MVANSAVSEIDNFVFNAFGYDKPPVLALESKSGRTSLNNFYKNYSPTTGRIRNNEEMVETIKDIDISIKYVKPAKKWAGYAGMLLEGFSASQDGISMSLNGILNAQPPSAVSAGLPSVYIVEEDEIAPQVFAEFISRFQQITDERKPRVLLIANDKLESALQLISTCGDNVSAHVISSGGLTKIAPNEMACDSLDQFIDLFLNEGDGYVATSEISLMLPDKGVSADFTDCVASMLQVQSHFRCGQKFAAAGLVRQIETKLQTLIELARTDEQSDKILSIKAIANLWNSYLSESNPEKIENSLSIAEHLRDDLLTAYALKLIPIVSGQSSLTHQQLEKAKKIFESRGELEQSLFVENNIIDNNLYSDRVDVERAVNLSRYVAEYTPYIRRSTTFHSNAAIALMLTGRLTEARELFHLARRGSGPAVNLLTTEVNSLIADYLDGETIESDQAIRLINKIQRGKISRNFDYQQTSMFANIWKIVEHDKEVSDYIVDILRQNNFLDYAEFLDSPDTLIQYVATRGYHPDAKRPITMPGVAGAFIKKHNLRPSSQVFYR